MRSMSQILVLIAVAVVNVMGDKGCIGGDCALPLEYHNRISGGAVKITCEVCTYIVTSFVSDLQPSTCPFVCVLPGFVRP